MSFLNYIFANHWAIDGKVGRAALGFIERRSFGVRNSADQVAAIVAGRSAVRAGDAVAMDDDDAPSGRRPTPMEISRPWDGVLMMRGEDERKRGYYVEDKVAVVPVEGVLCRYASLINDSSQPRGTSSEAIVRSLRAADGNPEVSAVVLNIDSPGGTVAGTEEVATAIRKMQKPVVAYAAYLCCSAAYWIASQARLIVAAETALVGNIGVYQVLEDSSLEAAQLGVKVHVIKAGKWKAIGVPGMPVTEDQLSVVQEEIDAIYGVFVGTVLKGRNAALGKAALSPEAVVKLADGRAWSGAHATQLKLADAVGTVEDAVGIARRMAGK